MTIGERVKKAREARGWTQKKLADRIGIAQPTISDLETGGHKTSVHLVKIAMALRVRAEWLETGAGRMEIDSSLDEKRSILNYYSSALTEKQLDHMIEQAKLFTEST